MHLDKGGGIFTVNSNEITLSFIECLGVHTPLLCLITSLKYSRFFINLLARTKR